VHIEPDAFPGGRSDAEFLLRHGTFF
jgi:hypothetical protein